ncbi:MAG: prepilin-type N-terminal cleavage/methylation domain-containing protein [Candidatus Taylorbacteria bacterium]
MYSNIKKGFTRTPKFGGNLFGKRGFTLIELLVVISIIGVLASIVMASLITARDKAKIAATKATLSSLKAAVAICNNSGSGLFLETVAGSAACLGEPALLPTATQLGATGVDYYRVGSGATTSYLIRLTGHPVAECNYINPTQLQQFYVYAGQLTQQYPNICK